MTNNSMALRVGPKINPLIKKEVNMGKSYAENTIKRYEALKTRNSNCQNAPGICLRKAMFEQTLLMSNGDISKIRLCLKHHTSHYMNATIIKEDIIYGR